MLRRILRWRIALHQHDAFHFVAIDVLQIAADSNLNIHAGDGNEIAVQQAAIAQLNGVVGCGPEFIADRTARNVIATDLKREVSRLKPSY